jgi:diguanylate cyclase (GGDEF)-like protein
MAAMESTMDKKDSFQQFEQLISSIEWFIRSTQERTEAGEERQYDIFLKKMSLNNKPGRRCWEIKNCEQLDCECRGNENYRCWLIAGTLSGACCSGSFVEKHKLCYDCEVFKQYLDHPISALGEHVNILVKHLISKIKAERELAIRDGLTGLYNRNFLKLIERGDILNFNHQSIPLSVIMFDLDMLKTVNDTYGHEMGDKMIKELSEFLLTHKREPDLLFRMGGDEFMLMMSGMDKKRRLLLEDRLIGLIRLWNNNRKKAIPAPLSFSLGGATGWSKELNQIIAEADTEMYNYKKFRRRKSTFGNLMRTANAQMAQTKEAFGWLRAALW